MGRTYARKRKTLTQSQTDRLVRAREARELKRKTREEIQALLELRKKSQESYQTNACIAAYQMKAKNATTKYWVIKRRTKRTEDTNAKHKEELKRLKEENKKLRREAENAEKEHQRMNEDIEQVIGGFKERVAKLTEERKELHQEKSNLKKKASRFQSAKKDIQERARQAAARGRVFKLTHHGVYTKQARELA